MSTVEVAGTHFRRFYSKSALCLQEPPNDNEGVKTQAQRSELLWEADIRRGASATMVG